MKDAIINYPYSRDEENEVEFLHRSFCQIKRYMYFLILWFAKLC